MAKKKKLSEMDIISLYMEYITNHATQPSSIDAFAETNNFKEDVFYEYFKNFDNLEKIIFKIFFKNTRELLEKSEDYWAFDKRNQLLSFYYTFFEILTANRGYIVQLIESHSTTFTTLNSLTKLKKKYKKYIQSLDIETLDLKQESLNNFQNKSLENAAWGQLLFAMKFWLEDTSAEFEKTDVFIEKLINTSFDLINTQPIVSLIDLGKFLVKEKLHK